MLSAHVLGRDAAQLPGQLVGQLCNIEGAGIGRLMDHTGSGQAPPWFRPRTRSLTPPGPLLRRFEGHEGWARTVAVLTDGRLALSASQDRTLRLWDLETGAELRRFEGHEVGFGRWQCWRTGGLRSRHLMTGRCGCGSWGGRVCLAIFTGDVGTDCVAVARDDLFVAGSANGALHILELRGLEPIPRALNPHPHLQAFVFADPAQAKDDIWLARSSAICSRCRR